MTIDEAIKDIKENIQPSVGGLSLEMVIQALEEIEEYRVKDFQCHLAQQEGISIGYNKAIDEFAAAIRDICHKCPIGTDADTNEPLYGHEDGTWHNLIDDAIDIVKRGGME